MADNRPMDDSLAEARARDDQLRDDFQRLVLAGDALATALTAVARGNPAAAELIRMWDAAKRQSGPDV